MTSATNRPRWAHKACSRCREDKPASAYHHCNSSTSGLLSACRRCLLQAATAKPKLLHKVCSNCRQDKPAAEYHQRERRAVITVIEMQVDSCLHASSAYCRRSQPSQSCCIGYAANAGRTSQRLSTIRAVTLVVGYAQHASSAAL